MQICCLALYESLMVRVECSRQPEEGREGWREGSWGSIGSDSNQKHVLHVALVLQAGGNVDSGPPRLVWGRRKRRRKMKKKKHGSDDSVEKIIVPWSVLAVLKWA